MQQNTARAPIVPKGLSLLTLAPLALLIAASPAQAQRERDDPGLQLNCANDFFRLCAGVDPSSADADNCMNRNRPRLSRECRAAIGDFNRRASGPRGRGPRSADPDEDE